MMLTLKREKFVQGLIAGLSQRESYKRAYTCTNWTNESIDRKACDLFANVQVRGRYDELMEQITSKCLYTRINAINDVLYIKGKARAEIEKKGLQKVSSDTFLGAIDRLISLNGLDLATTKNLELQTYKLQEVINRLRESESDTGKQTASMLEELIKNV